MRKAHLIALLSLFVGAQASAGENTFQVLAYHDVRDNVAEDYDPDQFAISTANLIDHFTWLRLNDFHVVSIDDILAAQRGERALPERAVLLTFDDGFLSVKTHVLPLLELFGYPAVISIVTDWIDSDPGVRHAGRVLTRDDFLTWNDIRELSNHELIEIASHSHAMHLGVIGNPQSNEQPAAVTMAFEQGSYESIDAYANRIHDDLTQSIDWIESATGERPRIMTWPFGAFSEITLDVASNLGMPMTLTLTDGINAADDLSVISRHLIQANPGVGQLSWSLLRPTTYETVRVAQVDLDYIFDEDPAQQERNLGRLLDRIQAMEITHVYLQAFADPDADGGAQALYFPNGALPMRADLFNRTAWQLKTRTNVLVYAWLPILSYEGDGIDPAWRVSQLIDGELIFDANSEPRLSPFSQQARSVIHGIYADLARHAQFDGILFHDDGRFNEFEDWSPAAVEAYREQFGADFSIEQLEASPELKAEWARFRSDALIDLTTELTATVRHFRPEIKTVRNLFATVLLEPEPELRLAQNYQSFLEAYDYVAIMAMPRFEGYKNHDAFYERLAMRAGVNGPARSQVIFELQTVEWPAGKPISSVELRDTMRRLQSLGVRNLAYYPDDFIFGHPDVELIREGMSIADFPQRVTR